MSTQATPSFVYVVYIASTAEKVFAALTDAEMSAQYWSGNRIVSAWTVGAPLALKGKQANVVIGKVLEIDPPRRLAYTFHSQHDGLDKEGPSRVTFDIEALKDQVKLTVTHDDFPVGSEVFGHISRGWPHVLSSLKSFLESGRGMLAPWYREVATA
jgi:uncharacterized protein YndB with AHSA1/START domain